MSTNAYSTVLTTAKGDIDLANIDPTTTSEPKKVVKALLSKIFDEANLNTNKTTFVFYWNLCKNPNLRRSLPRAAQCPLYAYLEYDPNADKDVPTYSNGTECFNDLSNKPGIASAFDNFLAHYVGLVFSSFDSGTSPTSKISNFLLTQAIAKSPTFNIFYNIVPSNLSTESEQTPNRFKTAFNQAKKWVASGINEEVLESARDAANTIDAYVDETKTTLISLEDALGDLEEDIEATFKSKTQINSAVKRRNEKYKTDISNFLEGQDGVEIDQTSNASKLSYCGYDVSFEKFNNEVKESVNAFDPDFRFVYYLHSGAKNEPSLNKLYIGENEYTGRSYSDVYEAMTSGYFESVGAALANRKDALIEGSNIKIDDAFEIPTDNDGKSKAKTFQEGWSSQNQRGQGPFYNNANALVKIKFPMSTTGTSESVTYTTYMTMDPASLSPIIIAEDYTRLTGGSSVFRNMLAVVESYVTTKDPESIRRKIDIKPDLLPSLIGVFYLEYLIPGAYGQNNNSDAITSLTNIINSKWVSPTDSSKLAGIFTNSGNLASDAASDAAKILSYIDQSSPAEPSQEEEMTGPGGSIFNVILSMMPGQTSGEVKSATKSAVEGTDAAVEKAKAVIEQGRNAIRSLGEVGELRDSFNKVKQAFVLSEKLVNMTVNYSDVKNAMANIGFPPISQMSFASYYVSKKGLALGENLYLDIKFPETEKLEESVIRKYVRKLLREAALDPSADKTDIDIIKKMSVSQATNLRNLAANPNSNAGNFESRINSVYGNSTTTAVDDIVNAINKVQEKGDAISYSKISTASAENIYNFFKDTNNFNQYKAAYNDLIPTPAGNQGGNQGGGGQGSGAGEPSAEGDTEEYEYKNIGLKPIEGRGSWKGARGTRRVEEITQQKRMKEYERVDKGEDFTPNIDIWIYQMADAILFRNWMADNHGSEKFKVSGRESTIDSAEKLKKSTRINAWRQLKNSYVKEAWKTYGLEFLKAEGIMDNHYDLVKYKTLILQSGQPFGNDEPVTPGVVEPEEEITTDVETGGGDDVDTDTESDTSGTVDLSNINEKMRELRHGRCGTFVNGSVIISPIGRTISESNQRKIRRKIRSMLLKNQRFAIKEGIKSKIASLLTEDALTSSITQSRLRNKKSEDSKKKRFEAAVPDIVAKVKTAIPSTDNPDLGSIIGAIENEINDGYSDLSIQQQSKVKVAVLDELLTYYDFSEEQKQEIEKAKEAYTAAAQEPAIAADEGEESVFEDSEPASEEDKEAIQALVNQIVSEEYFGNTGWVTFGSFDQPNLILYAVCAYDPKGNYEGQAYPTDFNVGTTKIETMYAEIQSKVNISNKNIANMMDLAMKKVLDGSLKNVGYFRGGSKTNSQGWNDVTTVDNLGDLNYLDFAKRIEGGNFRDEMLRKDIETMNNLLAGRNIRVGQSLVNAAGKIEGLDKDSSAIEELKNKNANLYSLLVEEMSTALSDMRQGETFDFAIVEKILGGNRNTYKIVSKDKTKQEKINGNEKLSRLFERVFKNKAFEFTGQETRRDVRKDVNKLFSEYERNYEKMKSEYIRKYMTGVKNPEQLINSEQDGLLRSSGNTGNLTYIDTTFDSLDNEVARETDITKNKFIRKAKGDKSNIPDFLLKLAIGKNDPSFIGIYDDEMITSLANKIPAKLNNVQFKNALKMFYDVEGFKGAARGLGRRLQRDKSSNQELDISRSVLLRFTYFPAMDTSDIYQTIIRPMIVKAGGKMSGAAGVDDEDVVNLNESRRIERLYLKNLLRESVKDQKKEVIKQKIERVISKRRFLQEADVALDDYESAISALRKTRKKKKMFGKRKSEEEEISARREDSDPELEADLELETDEEATDLEVDIVAANSTTAGLLARIFKRGSLGTASQRAQQELSDVNNGKTRLTNLKKYYEAGGASNPTTEAARALANNYVNLPGAFDDKTYWSAAFISYCMEPYKSIGFKPSMAHTVYAKVAYNNRDTVSDDDDSLVLFFKDEGVEPKPGDILFYLRDNNNSPVDLDSTKKFFEDHSNDNTGYPAHSDIFIGDGKAIGGNLSNSVKEVSADKYTAFITRLVRK